MKGLYLLIDWVTWPLRALKAYQSKRYIYKYVKAGLENAVKEKRFAAFSLKWEGETLKVELLPYIPAEHINVTFNIDGKELE